MDKFVIWDNVEKTFRSDFRDFVGINTKGQLYTFKHQAEMGTEYSIYWDVGLRDINKNSIYANCSIIEFKHKTLTEKVIGYFTFDDSEYLRYEIKILSINPAIENKSNFVFAKHLFSDIKIIDTIQENKLGLIK